MSSRVAYPNQTSFLVEYENDTTLALTDSGSADDDPVVLCADYVLAELVLAGRYSASKRIFFWDRENGIYQIEHDNGEIVRVVHCSQEQTAFIQHLVLSQGVSYAN